MDVLKGSKPYKETRKAGKDKRRIDLCCLVLFLLSCLAYCFVYRRSPDPSKNLADPDLAGRQCREKAAGDGSRGAGQRSPPERRFWDIKRQHGIGSVDPMG